MAQKSEKPRKPRKKTTVPSKNFASKVGNGNALFLDASGAIDGRSLPARRFRELTINLASDLGGADQISEIQKQLAKRFAGASVVAEMMEAAIVKGDKEDIGQYCTLINALNRLGGTLGVRRAVLDVTPSLQDYLAARAAQEPAGGRKGEGEDG